MRNQDWDTKLSAVVDAVRTRLHPMPTQVEVRRVSWLRRAVRFHDGRHFVECTAKMVTVGMLPLDTLTHELFEYVQPHWTKTFDPRAEASHGAASTRV